MRLAKFGVLAVLLAACSEEPRKVELVQVGAATDWAHVSAGAYDICATKQDGSAWCFSNGRHWEQYAPGFQYMATPEPLTFDYDVAEFSIGPKHSCLVAANFRLYCWGDNEFGQLGIEGYEGIDPDLVEPNPDDPAGNPFFREFPSRVQGTGKWLDVAAGLRHTCGLKSDHSLWCWGDRVTAETVEFAAAATDATSATAAENDYVRWVSALPYAFVTSEPTLIDDQHVWTSVFARDDVTCALDQRGALYCAHLEAPDDDIRGPFFDDILTAEARPAKGIRFRRVTQDVPWAHVSIGAHFSCAVGQDETLWCWETLLESEGYFRVQIEMPTPQRFGRSAAWSHVSAGSEDVCALTTRGKIWCYTGGKRTAEDGETTYIYWLPVGRKSTWIDVSVGGTQSCAVRDDGTLWCWKTFCSRHNSEGVCK